MTKICPLLKEDCRRENCGWWSELDNCSIPLLTEILDVQVKTLLDIEEHMK